MHVGAVVLTASGSDGSRLALKPACFRQRRKPHFERHGVVPVHRCCMRIDVTVGVDKGGANRVQEAPLS